MIVIIEAMELKDCHVCLLSQVSFYHQRHLHFFIFPVIFLGRYEREERSRSHIFIESKCKTI